MSQEEESASSRFVKAAPWIAALVVASALLAFLPLAAGKTIVDEPEVNDIGNQWIAFAQFARQAYLDGHFPLWDPHDLCGMPFLAFSHTGSLYPPTTLFRLLCASYHVSTTIDVFFHLTLAALGAFAFFQGAGRSRAAAFVGGVAFAFSGFVFSNVNFPPSFHTAAWMPLCFAGAFALLKTPRWRSFALMALAVAAMVVGGDLEMCVYAALGLGFEFALRRGEGSGSRAGLVAIVIAGGIGLALAMAQVLGSVEMQALSIRSEATFSPRIHPLFLVATPLFTLFHLPTLSTLFPANHGLSPWYFGFFIVLLIAAGARHSSYARRRALFFPAMIIYMVLMYVPPFNAVSHHIPVLGKMIVPLRIWPVLSLFMLLAATSAMDQWVRAGAGAGETEPESGTPWRSLLPLGKTGAAYLIVFGVATAASLIWVRHGLATRALFCGAVIAAGTVVLAGWRQDLLTSARARAALAVALVMIDLYLLALSWAPRTDPERLGLDPRVEAILADTADQQRYLITSIWGLLDRDLPSHLGQRLHADTIDAFSRVPPNSSARRLALLYPKVFRYQDGKLRGYDQMAVRDPKNLDLDQLWLLNELNVVWIIGRYPWTAPDQRLKLKLEASWPDLYVYKNLSAKPRVRVPGRKEAGKVTRLHNDQVEITRPALSDDGSTHMLSWSESWYPGWRARADGRELCIASDKLGLMRLPAPKEVTLSLQFAPASFRLGLWVSLASMLSLFLAGGLALMAIPRGRGH